MKEWYLMDNHTPNAVSGYEGDILSDYGQSNFNDVLETTFADSVVVYNSELSESREVKCVIQGNSADTRLSSLKREGLFPIGSIKAGMYVYFNKAFWIVTGYPGENKSYEKVSLNICQHKLKWQNSDGDVIERWANFTSASKYNDGLQEGRVITLSSDNLSILIPRDSETLELEYRRVFIDNRPVPSKVYLISRSDDVLYDYGCDGGILNLIADRVELDVSRDNQELGICDYVSPDAEEGVLQNPEEYISGVIQGGKNLKVGIKRSYKAVLPSEDGTSVGWTDEYAWCIKGEIPVSSVVNGAEISIMVENEDFVGSTFELQILKGDTIVAQSKILISGAF